MRLPLSAAAGVLSRIAATGVVALALASCSAATPAIEGAAADVRGLTGAHARVVWVQGDGTDAFAMGTNFVLMGFDTDDGRGERPIVETRGSFAKPLFLPKGDRLVYSTSPAAGGPEVFLVHWDGSGRRRLGAGFALAAWQDPADGREWLYVGTDHDDELDFATVWRFPVDDPARRELVWNQSKVGRDTFQVSADGRAAGGVFPWPHVGVADLPNGTFRMLADGCWTALSNPGPPVLWFMDGAHRNLTLIDLETDRRWSLPINEAPGFRNPEVYHPRWTNHPRFLAITGPYDQGGANQVRTGGTQTEVYLGRFSADYTRVEAWARVTHNAGGDLYPDVWIDTAGSPHAMRASGTVGPDAAAPPAAAGGAQGSRVVVEARLVTPGVIPSPEAILPYRHALVVNHYEIVRVVAGEYDAPAIQVAQWAIRDTRVLAEARKAPGTLHRLTVERFSAHPELEGERLIASTEPSTLPLYYEVGS